jgi:glutaredoxin
MSKLNQLSKIVVFGAEYCNFCHKAKAILENKNAKFSYLDIE